MLKETSATGRSYTNPFISGDEAQKPKETSFLSKLTQKVVSPFRVSNGDSSIECAVELITYEDWIREDTTSDDIYI